MRILYFSWVNILILSMLDLNAQFLTRSVISALGTNNLEGEAYVSSTIGEGISGTFYNSQNYLTQGFQQPRTIAPYNPFELNLDAIDVFPNPFTDYIKIAIEVKDINNYDIEIYSIQGSKLLSFVINNIYSGIYEINLQELPPGVYVLQIRSALLKTNKTFRIIKT
jgi:hypothetical protein